VNKFGKCWSKISNYLGSRNGKQIRDRFLNVLDPEIKKDKFTDEEDEKLIQLYHQYGTKWSTIVKAFPQRTSDMIKNRFYSSIKKRCETSKAVSKGCQSQKDNMSTISKNENYSTVDSSNEIFDSFFNSKSNSLFSSAAEIQEEAEYSTNNIYNLEHKSFGPSIIIESEGENSLYNIYEQINTEKFSSNDNVHWNFDDMFLL